MDDFRIIGQSSKLLLRIAHDGAIELGPDIQPEEAKEVATALSTYVQDLKATIARYEAVAKAADAMADEWGRWYAPTLSNDACDIYREARARLDQDGDET